LRELPRQARLTAVLLALLMMGNGRFSKRDIKHIHLNLSCGESE
jgi:hypothetical protein